MLARFEIGDVLLTASIFEVLRQVAVGVVTRNVATRDQFGERKSARTGQFAGLTERKNTLRIKRKGEFSSQARLNLRNWQAKAAGYGFRNVEMKCHKGSAHHSK